MATTKINCLHCGQEAHVENKEIARGFGKFCSHKCSSIYNAEHRPKPESNVNCAYCGVNFYINRTKKKNSKSGLYFCCRKHKDIAQRIGGIREIMPPHYGTTVSDYRVLVFRVAGKPKVCERCGYDKHEAGIIVHHRDRNRDNNDISNLEVLCAICHAIEHHNE